LFEPLATKQALYLSIVPSAFFLILYTHLHPIMFLPFGQGTNCQVLLRRRALYSLSIAATQFLFARAAATVGGSSLDTVAALHHLTVPSV
jgi:hypothetical protein